MVAAGAAGAITPDLPLEEAIPWLAAAQQHGLYTVPVVAPTANDERLPRICSTAGGMIYAPAVAGVTGQTGPLAAGLPDFVTRLRTLTALPVADRILDHYQEVNNKANKSRDVVSR
ncbi:tryptophan synthase subunit alpha [Streptomyces sp. NPDC048211]|uniref:tryptophan synthase subunit alpha n=1 Tax=Streptomyces sp. NPDC048211 TaxID=3365516 RepID=UPI0037143D91